MCYDIKCINAQNIIVTQNVTDNQKCIGNAKYNKLLPQNGNKFGNENVITFDEKCNKI